MHEEADTEDAEKRPTLEPANRPTEEESGWGGIRTPGSLSTTPVFKTGALNRSATHPFLSLKH
ncbi:MAG: hypothetical protein RLY14_845 [Planctomycetota bacterium]